jgi:hypothetical protein
MTEFKIENSTKYGIILLRCTLPVVGNHLGLVQQLVVPWTCMMLAHPPMPSRRSKQKMLAGSKNCVDGLISSLPLNNTGAGANFGCNMGIPLQWRENWIE